MVATIEQCILWKFKHYKQELLFSENQEIEKTTRSLVNYGISLSEKLFDSFHFDVVKKMIMSNIASFLGIVHEIKEGRNNQDRGEANRYKIKV